jgi:hypothetical protein
MLVIDQSTSSMTFGASVSGLANSSQKIDLANTSFSNVSMSYSGGTTSGTLTVTNGAETTNLNLIGDYTLANFKSASDGNGGTLIYDPPIVANGGGGSEWSTNHALFVNYMAALSDAKQFGSTLSATDNYSDLGNAARISPPFAGHHHT